MRNRVLFTLFACVFFTSMLQAQEVTGKLIDSNGEPLMGALISIDGSDLRTYTDVTGNFTLSPIDPGTYDIIVEFEGTKQSYEAIRVTDGITNLGNMDFVESTDDGTQEQLFGIISISENDLDADNGNVDVSSILTAGRDPFLNTAAFAFGSARFRTRGLDSENQNFYLNGILMNELESGRLFYNQWGGLNDVLRNVHVNYGLSHSEHGIGGLLGNSNVDVRAGTQREQTRVSYARANRSYFNRIMFTHAKGFDENGISYFVSGSRRWAQEGYVDGTFYDAYSYALGVEKKFSENSSVFLNVLGAPNKRGKQSATLPEISEITGNNYYNSYWGWQEGKKRNSRVSNSHQPIIMAGHDWAISDKTLLNTALSYQFGENGGTALNWLNAGNPAGDYHQKLPSRIESEELKLLVIDQIQNENPDFFQVDWTRLYEANRDNFRTIDNINGTTESISGNQARYIVENRRFDSKELNAHVKMTHHFSDKNTFIAGAYYRNYEGHNFATLDDLLGADFFVDWDNFASPGLNPGTEQRDLNNPNAIKYVGDVIGWDYNSNINKAALWLSDDIRLSKFDIHIGGELSRTEFWRTGNMRNGYHPENSFGDSEKNEFLNYTAKLGVTYKLSGRNYFWANGYLGTQAPTFRNSYISNRNSNETVPLLEEVKSKGAEVGFLYDAPGVRFKTNAYYADIDDLAEISFFFSENATGEIDGAFGAFVNHNIDKRHVGIESAITAKLNTKWEVKAVAALGQHLYDSRWRNYGFADLTEFFREDILVYSNEFFVDGSPQKAYNFELKYNSPKFWFATVNFNFFQDRYLDFSPERRIEFNTAGLEGQELRDVSIQERVDDAFTMDVFAYKSWKLKNGNFVILTASVSNILDNRNFITGGYEQLRYDQEEGPDYFDKRLYYGYGLNYFLQVAYKL